MLVEKYGGEKLLAVGEAAFPTFIRYCYRTRGGKLPPREDDSFDTNLVIDGKLSTLCTSFPTQ
jgi:hypothetical protein